VVTGVLTRGYAAEARGVPAVQAAAVVAVAGVIAIRLWPAVVGRSLAAFVAEPSPAAAEEAARRSRALLASLSGATAIQLFLASRVLLNSGDPFAIGLAAATGVALLLRAQAYRFLADALAPALAGAAVLLLLELALAGIFAGMERPELALGLPAVTAAGLAALAATRPRVTPPVPGTRLAWLVVDLSLAPLLLGTVGVFALIGQLVHHFVH
jgi:hypothetical protein